MPTASRQYVDAGARAALASMLRVLRNLEYERHPIVDRPVCYIEHEDDAILVDEFEIQTAADHALDVVIETEIPKFGHLPDIRLDAVCRRHLACCAMLLPSRWTL